MASIGLAIFSAFSSVVAGALSVANALNPWGATSTKDHSWQKPSPTDRRSSCPMVNALANHGYLPRDGRSVSLAQLLRGCREGINLGADATLLVGVKALQTSSTGNPLTFHLDDLSKHGFIEHDGSLSRKDVAQGDNHTFDPEIWATVRTHFTEDKISIETAAAARKARLAAAPAANPEFHMSDADVHFSFLETCLYLHVFGEGINGNAPTQWVRTLFEHERLPFEEGFKRSDKPLTIADILALEKKVKAASA